MASGIYDPGVFTVEYVTLHISLETEHESVFVDFKNLFITLVRVRRPDPPATSIASFVKLQPYFVINQRLMYCSFYRFYFS